MIAGQMRGSRQPHTLLPVIDFRAQLAVVPAAGWRTLRRKRGLFMTKFIIAFLALLMSAPVVLAQTAPSCATCPKLTRDSLVIVIRDKGWVEQLRAQHKVEPLVEPFVEDLVIVYAIHEPDRIGFVLTGDEKALGLNRSQLRALAMKNLKRVIPKIELVQMPPSPLLSISAGGDYDASLMLFDDIWTDDQLKTKIEGDVVIAAPAGDLILITGSRSRKGIAALRKIAKTQLQKTSHPLTETLFVYRDGAFKRYGKKPKVRDEEPKASPPDTKAPRERRAELVGR